MDKAETFISAYGADQSTIAAAEKFGSGFGILFQLIDDIKDGDCKNLPDTASNTESSKSR